MKRRHNQRNFPVLSLPILLIVIGAAFFSLAVPRPCSAVAPNAPVINSPANAASFNGGDYITFSGTCTDTEDGVLSGSSLVWISSKDGPIGTGQTFSLNTLQSGTHTITLIATDSESLSSITSITITVGNNAPTSTITLPATNGTYSAGTAITFSGTGSDIDSGDSLSYSWTSTLLGVSTVIGTQSTISVSNLAVGTHVIILTVSDGNGGITASASRTITITNNAPTATILNPANNATFYPGTTISFIGQGTDSEDGSGALTYEWSSNDSGVLSTAASFTTSSLTAGSHTITFKVTDSNGTSNTTTQSITIHIGNYTPTVSITSPTTGTSYNMGQVITFRGSASDTEDGTLTGANLVWTSSISGVIGTGTLFTLNNLQSGTHVITLTASDNYSTPATATASIIITINNTFPTSSISFPTTGSTFYAGTNITFSGVAQDAEDGTLTGASLVWSSNLMGTIGTGSPLTINTLIEGTHIITLTATDSSGAATASSSITITVGNAAPTAAITSPADGSSFNQGSAITFRGTGSDNEDGTLTGTSLSWRSSIDGVIGTGTILPVSSLSTGTHTITLTVTDSQGSTAIATIAVTVVNNSPVVLINTPPDNSVYDNGSAITLSGTAIDPEDGMLTGLSLSWSSSLDGALGTGTSLSNVVLSKGSHIITLTATDSEGKTGSDTIQVNIGNTPPTVSILAPVTGTHYDEGAYITFLGSGTDTEDGTLTGTSLVWMSSISGEIATGSSPAPINTLPVGRHIITLVATDSNAATTTSTSISIRVGNTPPVPSILSPANNTAFESGQTITFEGTGVDTEDGVLTGTALVWTSDRQGQIGTGNSLSLTNLASGRHTITLTVTDLDGSSTSTSITIKAQNTAPVVTITSPTSGSSVDEGNTILFQGTATDHEDGALTGSYLTWSSNLDGTLGTGNNLSLDTLSSGTHTITLTATDYDGTSTSASITVTIVPMTLSAYTMTLAAGESDTVTIIGGKSPYRVATRRSQIAVATENNGTVTVRGISAGGTIITVTDNKKKSRELFVTVTSPDVPVSDLLPDAYAGPDQSQIAENSLVQLSGKNLSDPTGAYTAFLWTQTDPNNPGIPLAEPTVTLSNPTSPTPTFTAPLIDINGPMLCFQLTVITANGSSTDTMYITLKNNGITGFPAGVIRFKSSTDKSMGIQLDGGGLLSMVTASAPADFESSTRPQSMLFGLIAMKIISLSAGETAVITIFLPEAAPAGYSWFKYVKDQDTWIDFDRQKISNGTGDGAVFSEDRRTVTLYITDDGPYDDNKTDGIIEDPSGLGKGPLVSNSGNEDGGGGGGCFVDSVL